MSRRSVRIGTTGWHYDGWKGPFYPDDLSDDDMLGYYADRFDTVEISGSFYKLPARDTAEGWRDGVSASFLYAAKASRYITHMKKLKDPKEPLRTLYQGLEPLGSKLGPILFQLPPGWFRNAERLQAFLEQLSDDHRHAFEFRDPDWHDEETFALLRRHGQSFCIHHLEGYLAPLQVTNDLVYVRLHGPKGAYEGRYTKSQLEEWAERFDGWSGKGRQVLCYFDNDQEGHAPNDAMRLREILGQV